MERIRTSSATAYARSRTAVSKACATFLLCICAASASTAHAGEFNFENGLEGSWTLGASLGTSWRAKSADPALVSLGNGGTTATGGGSDDGTLNYDKGDIFSTVALLRGEVKLKMDNLGAVVGGKAWYDNTAKKGRVAHGSYANGYEPGARLNDSEFDSLSKFSGVALGNAYGFGTFNLGSDKVLNVKLGNQVVNWGESIFIPGVSQFGAFDVTASKKAGAQVKDILLPIPQLAASLSLGSNASVEAFYQFKWKKNVLDGCGTYWSVSDLLNCPGAVTAAATPSDRGLYNGYELIPSSGVIRNLQVDRAADVTPKDSGQFGLAGHYFSVDLGTDLGLYYVNYHTRNPIYSTVKTPSSSDSLFSGEFHDLTALLRQFNPSIPQAPYAQQFFWDYSADNIQVLAVSASTTLGGWAVAAEASYTKGFAVQINTVDLGQGAAFGAGRMAYLANVPDGTVARGYDRKNKSQIQLSTNKTFSHIAGAQSLLLIGEIGFQHWSGIGDPATSIRYGRAALFGIEGNDGFFTANAGGYRILAQLNYSDVFSGVSLAPRVFWSHDVKGMSADSSFIQNRKILGLGVRAEYNKDYYADLSYTAYGRATYDLTHDRDYFSAVIGLNF